MSGQNRLVSVAWGPIDISAGANAVYTYTCPAGENHALFFRVFCTTVAGNGDYVFWLTLREAGAGNTAVILPKTTGTAAVADTTIAALTTTIMVDAGDVVKIYIDGLAGDIAVSGTVKVYEFDYLRPTTVGQSSVDVDALGGIEVGAMQSSALAQFFTVNSGQTGAGAIAGSVVHEIGHAVLAIGTVFPAGAIDFTYTLTDSVTLLPIQGADVWFSTDAGGVNIVWKGVTDAFGVARDVNNNLPWLDAGTYRVWAQRVGYAPSSFPDVEVAS